MIGDEEQARHQRRMQLMREMAKLNKMQTRLYILYAVAGLLAALALILEGLGI